MRVFDIRDQFAPKEIAYWVPLLPAKLIDPRSNIAPNAKTADPFVNTEEQPVLVLSLAETQ